MSHVELKHSSGSMFGSTALNPCAPQQRSVPFDFSFFFSTIPDSAAPVV